MTKKMISQKINVTLEEEEEEKEKESVEEKSPSYKEENDWKKTTIILVKKTQSVRENITMFQELVNGEDFVGEVEGVPHTTPS